jgi:hypothetical protein
MSKRRRISYNIWFVANPPVDEEIDDSRWIIVSPLDPPTLPYPIAVKLGKSDDGKLVCVGMRLGEDAIPGWNAKAVPGWNAKAYPSRSRQITSQTLREIPVGQLLDDLANWRALPDVEGTGLVGQLNALLVVRDEPRSHPGRRGYPLAFYEGIRDLYREALEASPGHVCRYIAEHAKDADGRLMYGATERDDLQESREAVARKWVRTTRQKGLLGAARHGKAGEYPAIGPSRESGQDTSSDRKEKQ